MKYLPFLFLTILLISSCTPKESVFIPETVEPLTIENLLASNYVQMPERQIAISQDQTIYAQYSKPTERYRHGILGDVAEATQMVVVKEGIFWDLNLSEDYVFEDIRPRIYDVDGDGELEFICIRTHINKGAGIAIYKLSDSGIKEYAFVPEIGTSSRWLNIVAINDLDDDGIVELVWIETPHIGGILKIAAIKEGQLTPVEEVSGYSNHAIGEINLCLSVVTLQGLEKVFYVPTQNRDKIVGFLYASETLRVLEEIDKMVSFSKPLDSQYDFKNLIEEEDNCIHLE